MGNFLYSKDRLGSLVWGRGLCTCDDLHSKGLSAAVPDLAEQGDCVRGTSFEAWNLHGVLAARNRETLNFSGLVSLLDLNDKLLIDPIGAGPVQSEGIPANLGHCEVPQTWSLLCTRRQGCRVTKKRQWHSGIQLRWHGGRGWESCLAGVDHRCEIYSR